MGNPAAEIDIPVPSSGFAGIHSAPDVFARKSAVGRW
jgi:hypothetical protein